MGLFRLINGSYKQGLFLEANFVKKFAKSITLGELARCSSPTDPNIFSDQRFVESLQQRWNLVYGSYWLRGGYHVLLYVTLGFGQYTIIFSTLPFDTESIPLIVLS